MQGQFENNNQPFVKGRIYKRTILQDQFGGNRQSGIAASASYPYILIFSGDAGHQHGYKDEWENSDVFAYTGEGQLNDMQFIRGNLALRDHIQNRKRVFLFVHDRRAYVKFEAELEFIDFDFFIGNDRDGKERTAIKFFFKRKGTILSYNPEQTSISLAAEDEVIYRRNTLNITEREGLITSRVGQGAYRKSILYRWNFKCAVTNYTRKEILIASHILPWKDASNDERLDVDNGILLSPTYDALFDKKLIGFENNGKIILSDKLLKSNYSDIGVTGREVIKSFNQSNHIYLERHRQTLMDL